MPWQSYVADVVNEIDPATGLYVYDEFGLLVPRQSGKSTWVLAKATHRCSATSFFGSRQNLVYTAQTRKDARKKWEEDFAVELEASATFKAKIAVRKGGGNEHIRFQNGSRFGIEANTDKAGHGGTIDEAYLDEAFGQADGRMETAFGPAMITRLNKQLGWISTAGWLDASPYLSAKVKAARQVVESGEPSTLAYFEWSAPEDADPEDRALWPTYMPALGYKISEKAIAGVLAKALRENNLSDFRRSYMNLWVPKPVAAQESVISAEIWGQCLDVGSYIIGPPVFAVDVSPDHSWASIAAAGFNAADAAHVEVTGRDGVVDHRPGTEWTVPRLTELRLAFPDMRIAIAAGSSAGALKPDLDAAGIPVDVIGSRDVAAGCGLFYTYATTAGRLAQLGQPDLDDALVAAKKRVEDGETAWVWGRKRSSADITPLYAATLALWALVGASNLALHPINNVW
jgi:hypothetical protein